MMPTLFYASSYLWWKIQICWLQRSAVLDKGISSNDCCHRQDYQAENGGQVDPFLTRKPRSIRCKSAPLYHKTPVTYPCHLRCLFRAFQAKDTKSSPDAVPSAADLCQMKFIKTAFDKSATLQLIAWSQKFIIDIVQKAAKGSSLAMHAGTRVAAKVALIAETIVLGVGLRAWFWKPWSWSPGFDWGLCLYDGSLPASTTISRWRMRCCVDR